MTSISNISEQKQLFLKKKNFPLLSFFLCYISKKRTDYKDVFRKNLKTQGGWSALSISRHKMILLVDLHTSIQCGKLLSVSRLSLSVLKCDIWKTVL